MTYHGDIVGAMRPEDADVLALRKLFVEEYRDNFDAIDFHGRPSTAYVAWLERKILRGGKPLDKHGGA